MAGPFKSIKKPQVPVDVDLGQILSEGLLGRPQTSPDLDLTADLNEDVTEITQEEFDELLSNLIESQEPALQYNSVADEEFHIPNQLLADRDAVRALKNSNRFRAVQYQEQIARYKGSYQRAMASTEFGADYNRLDRPSLFSMMVNLFGRSAEDARINTQRYGALKELEKGLAEDERDTINKEFKFFEPTDTPGYLDLSGFGVEQPVRVDDYDISVVVEGIEIWEDRLADPPSDGVPFGAAIGIGYSSVLDAEGINSGVVQTLGKIDENTTYIDSLFELGPNDTVNSDVGGRPESYTLSEIYENCFDCFIGAWNGDYDFRFNLDVELRLKALLDVIQDLLDAIKYALDIEGIMLSNACSLMRLGVMCPIEIAFLLASLAALMRFALTEVIFNFRGFLAQLISALLLPLFNALELASNFAIAPFNVYVGCVMRTLLSAQQVAWTGAFTRQQMHDALNGGFRRVQLPETPFRPSDHPLNQRIREQNERRIQESDQRIEDRSNRRQERRDERSERRQERREARVSEVDGNGNPIFPINLEEQSGRDQTLEANLGSSEDGGLTINIPQEEIDRFRETVSTMPSEIVSDILLRGGHSSRVDLQSWLSDRNLVEFSDPVEFYILALIESSQVLNSKFLWIKNALAGLKAWAKSNSITRLELTAKIIALSTLAGVLGAIASLLIGDVPVCNESFSPDGTRTLEPNFTPEEFLNIIGLPALLNLETTPGNEDATIIVDGEPVSQGGPEGTSAVLVNTETGSRFSLVNCEKGKTRTVSNLELQATLRNLGIS